MLLSTPLPTPQTRRTRRTRPNSSMLSSTRSPLAKLAKLAQTRPYPQFRRHRFLAALKPLWIPGLRVNLISPTLVESLGLLLTPVPAVKPVILADGSSSAFQVRHHVRIRFCLPTLCRSWTISALVCRTGSAEMILGLPWIKANSTIVDWAVPCLVNLACSRPLPMPSPCSSASAIRVSAAHAPLPRV